MVEGNGGEDDLVGKLSQRLTHNLEVTGSNPASATIKHFLRTFLGPSREPRDFP